jgi:hypothetical protein
MLQVDPIQSYLNLKIGLPPVLKAGSSGRFKKVTPQHRSHCFYIFTNQHPPHHDHGPIRFRKF